MMNAGERLLAVLIAALLFAAGSPALAAESATGSVSGTVRSSDGAPIEGAAVSLSGNGPSISLTSDRSGAFAAISLPPGTYLIGASAKGFTGLTGRIVQIAANATTTLALTLPKAQVAALAVIASVSAGGSQSLSTAPAPTLTIGMQPYAQRGVLAASTVLQDQLSTTVIPVVGGGLNAPASVAVRSGDPSETLIDVDGHQVNNGNTGDFDLSLLDPADLQNLQVIYGIAPSALYGPNSEGGALNVTTLEPTAQPHTLLRFTGGSYTTFGETLNTTGSAGRLGYVASYHRVTSGGQLSGYEIPTSDGTGQAPVGNAMDATSWIGKLRYGFGRGDAFVGVTFRDQSVYRDLSAALSSVQTPADGAAGPGDAYSNYSGTSSATTNLAYGLDAQLPIGRPNADGIVPATAIFRYQLSLTNQSVNGPGAATSPYLYNNRDQIDDYTLEIDRTLPHATLSVKAALTQEALLTGFVPGVASDDAVAVAPVPRGAHLFDDDGPASSGLYQEHLGQTQRWIGVAYNDDPTAKLHYSFAGYVSNFSTFGSSVDPRFGFVWTPAAASALRFSVGTTFQSPQLPTLVVPPVLPPPVDGYVSTGNPNARAEHATAYDLGYEHVFAGPQRVKIAADLYRADVHGGTVIYYSTTQCQAGVDYGDNPPCLSYPANAAEQIYQGIELRGDVTLRTHLALHAAYDVNSVFTQSYLPAAAGDQPLYEQALGVPLHKLTVTLEDDKGYGLGYSIGMLYEGTYNELNLPPYATLRAGLTWHTHGYTLGLYGTNLTNVYNFLLTKVGAGVPYGGLSGPQPTNAIPLAGPQIVFSLSRRT
jgi:outer membrane cobalamin receptor